MRHAVSLFFALLCGCSEKLTTVGADASSGNDGAATTCVATFSGAVTATGDCNPALGFSASKQQAVFGLSYVTAPATVSSWAVAATLASGSPSTGTFTESTMPSSGADVIQSTTNAWVESHGASGQPDQGTLTVTISSIGTPVTASNGDIVYVGAHGTVDATLPPQTGTGALGTLTLHVAF